jgi:hypothetical protein
MKEWFIQNEALTTRTGSSIDRFYRRVDDAFEMEPDGEVMENLVVGQLVQQEPDASLSLMVVLKYL